jgi:thiaminase
MLPCYYLWYWLGYSLKEKMGNKMYGFWIEWNQSPRSAYAIGNFIADWQAARKTFDEALAFNIYEESMDFEYRMFDEEYRPEQLKNRLEMIIHVK